MPQAGPKLQTLRALDDAELRAIRRRFGWHDIDPLDNRGDYTQRRKF